MNENEKWVEVRYNVWLSCFQCFCMHEAVRGWHKQSTRFHFRFCGGIVVHTFKSVTALIYCEMWKWLKWSRVLRKFFVIGSWDAWIMHGTKVVESHITCKTKKHWAAMFHMSLWSRVAGPLNVQHVLETDCNWQDNKAHNVKKGVCVCVCVCVHLYLCQSWLLRWFFWWKQHIGLNLAVR